MKLKFLKTLCLGYDPEYEIGNEIKNENNHENNHIAMWIVPDKESFHILSSTQKIVELTNISDSENRKTDFVVKMNSKIIPSSDWSKTKNEEIKTHTLDYYEEKLAKELFNCLYINTRGTEFSILNGADKCLHIFNFIYFPKIPTNEIFLIEKINSFLEKYSFSQTKIEKGLFFQKNRNNTLYNYPQHSFKVFEPAIKTFVGIGLEYLPFSQEDKEIHIFGNEKLDCFHSSFPIENIHLDKYCEKMEINRINFLHIDNDNILKLLDNSVKILEFTDIVQFYFDKTFIKNTSIQNIYEILKRKGFTNFYLVSENSFFPYNDPITQTQGFYICMRSTWKENSIPYPDLGIVCINLEKSINRKKYTKNQLDKLGFPYVIKKAIDGKKINVITKNNQKYAEYCGVMHAYKPISRDLSYGELGCVLSHYFTYKSMLETNHEYFLILEDDNEITDINLARKQLFNIPKIPFDMCFMSASTNRKIVLEDKINNYFSKTSTDVFNRANAILFTRSGLAKLVARFEMGGIILPADDIIEKSLLSIITSTIQLYKCAEDIFRSDIWNLLKTDELFTEVKHDKPICNTCICMEIGGFSRMGNSFFQYAMMKAQSLEKNMHIFLTKKDSEIAPFSNIEYFVGTPQKMITLNETKFEYEEDLINKISSQNNYFISGYFQSHKYFEKYEDIIRDCFEIDSKIKYEAKRQYNSVSNGKSVCAVHVRLPDVRGEPSPIYSYPTEKYILESLKIIKEKVENVKFLVFSNDMEDCKNRFLNLFPPDTIYSENKDKFVDFALMTFCDHNIISSGSYGWWAAYLNKNPNKIVIAMKPNFNQNVERVKNNNEKDYHPENRIILEI